jgi:hypothetical protein
VEFVEQVNECLISLIRSNEGLVKVAKIRQKSVQTDSAPKKKSLDLRMKKKTMLMICCVQLERDEL